MKYTLHKDINGWEIIFSEAFNRFGVREGDIFPNFDYWILKYYEDYKARRDALERETDILMQYFAEKS